MAKVFANGRSIVHKGDGQADAAAPPDVCRTPSPAGPVPVPYVNVAASRDLAKGTRSVEIDGNPVAHAGSNLRTSTGDEAGTAGGGLLSCKTRGKLTWGTSSADVKVEGKGVVRFADVTHHNGNTFNTAFIQQGGTGLAYGDDFEGLCALCGKPPEKHRIREMKSSAGIAAEILKKLHSDPERYAKTTRRSEGSVVYKGYMVGVLVCRCRTWATTSGSTQEHFHEAAQGCTVVGGKGVDPYRLTGGQEGRYESVAEEFFQVTMLRRSNSKELAKLRSQASKPGECAAQKLLARARGHEILSMTEVYFQPNMQVWRQNYTLRASRGSGTRAVDMSFREFSAADAARGATDRSVASCHTCQVILPLVLCDLGAWKC